MALKVDAAHAWCQHSIKVVARCAHEETFGDTRVQSDAASRNTWTLIVDPQLLPVATSVQVDVL